MADENENSEAKNNKPAKAGGAGGMLPALLIIVLMPLISYGMFQFMFLPQLKKEIPHPDEHVEITAEDVKHIEHGDGDTVYDFTIGNVTANLRGTVHSRFIRVAYIVEGVSPELPTLVEKNEAKMRHVTIEVLKSLTLADLEKPEIQGVVSSQMKRGFEHVLKKSIIDNIYFSEFVVQ